MSDTTTTIDPEFNESDLATILESLRYTKRQFQEYAYPSENFRREQVAKVETVIDKITTTRKAGAK